jgi:hypothetical protein
MTSHLYEPNNFRYVERPRFPGVGSLLLAGGWLLLVGILNLFYAIAVIAGSDIFVTTASWLVGDARPWGALMLAVSLIQLTAVPFVLLARRWALWIAVISVLAHAAAAVMFLSDSVALGIALLFVDLTVLGALAITFEENS